VELYGTPRFTRHYEYVAHAAAAPAEYVGAPQVAHKVGVMRWRAIPAALAQEVMRYLISLLLFARDVDVGRAEGLDQLGRLYPHLRPEVIGPDTVGKSEREEHAVAWLACDELAVVEERAREACDSYDPSYRIAFDHWLETRVPHQLGARNRGGAPC
jgi:hypothetical protein